MANDGKKALVIEDEYRERISMMQQKFVKIFVSIFASVSQMQSSAFE